MAVGNTAIRVEGLDKVMKQLDDKVRKVRFQTKKGLIRAGLFIQGEAQKRVPVDLANLKASAFTVWGDKSIEMKPFKEDKGGKMSKDHVSVVGTEASKLSTYNAIPMTPFMVEVGFSAFYALYVHEDMQAKHPNGGEAKYLQKAVSENRETILKLVKEEISKVPKKGKK